MSRAKNCLGLGAALLTLSLVGACASDETPATFSDIRFTGAPPIRLDVSTVNVVSEFEPSFRPPEIEQNFPVPPQRALTNWAHDRLQADNLTSPLGARVTILDASAHELGNGTAYDIRLSVRVDIVDALGNQLKSLPLEASRTISADPDADADERDLAWYNLTKDAVAALTAELEKRIAANFYPYVK